MKNNKLLFNALQHRFLAQKTSALATLDVYSKNAAGIGEHPQIVDEMAKQLELLANAEDCLESLDKNFPWHIFQWALYSFHRNAHGEPFIQDQNLPSWPYAVR